MAIKIPGILVFWSFKIIKGEFPSAALTVDYVVDNWKFRNVEHQQRPFKFQLKEFYL